MKWTRTLLAVILVLVGCARHDSPNSSAEPAFPQWALLEAKRTDEAYRSESVENAIQTFRLLVSELRARADANHEYRIDSGIWVNKMRLAGAFYLEGDKASAEALMNEIVRIRAGKEANDSTLVSGRADIFKWLVGEYSVRKPLWGKEAVDEFSRAERQLR
jgi:hypothetical protein